MDEKLYSAKSERMFQLENRLYKSFREHNDEDMKHDFNEWRTINDEIHGIELKTVAYKDKKTSTKKYLIITVVFLIIGIFTILYFSGYFKKSELKKLETERAVITTKLDSSNTKHAADRSGLVAVSQKRADQSAKIKKSITDEKITISDTAYAAMCKYIANYQP